MFVVGVAVTLTLVNTPVPGVVDPMLTLSIVPTVLLVSWIIPLLAVNWPLTVNPVSVPTLVKLLVTTVDPKAVADSLTTPLILTVLSALDKLVPFATISPDITILVIVKLDDVMFPLASTENPGLANP